MLKARAARALSRELILALEGIEVARLQRALWNRKATLSISDGTIYTFAVLKNPDPGFYLMDAGGVTLAQAAEVTLDSWWQRLFFTREKPIDLDRQGTVHRLQSRGGGYALMAADTVVGSIRPDHGSILDGGQIDLPEEWPLPLQAFVFWLAVHLSSQAGDGG